MAAANRMQRGARSAILVSCTVMLALWVSTSPASALNIGIQRVGADVSVRLARCSRTCESEYCSLPPFLRYGKYCGILYSGCPGEKPCDGLDACCQIHDACVQAKHNYLDAQCNQNFLNCIEKFRDSGRPTFNGNKCSVEEVVDIISLVMEAALLAGRIIHKP